MGHELIHRLFDRIPGKSADKITVTTPDGEKKNFGEVPNEELGTVGTPAYGGTTKPVTENDLRREMDMPRRDSYTSTP